MLAISRGLMMRPKLFLLDEPSFGLAPLVVQEIFAIMRAINREQNVSMLLVEQNANLALDLADRAYLLETGRVVLSGSCRRPQAEQRRAALLPRLLNKYGSAAAPNHFRGSRPAASMPASRWLWSWSIRPPISLTFAQGEMAMFSTYGAWTLIRAGIPYWEAFVIVVVASFVIGVLLERFVVRPVAARSVLSVVVIFIGLLVIFNSVAGWIWTYSVQTFPTPFLDQCVS